MNIYGNLDFKEVGQLIAAAIKPEEVADFPTGNSIKQGRLAFFSGRAWIATEIISGVVTWVPITNEITSYVHTQDVANSTWTIDHNLYSGTPVVAVYDDAGYQLIPNEVQPTTINQVVISFGVAMTGRAVILSGDIDGVNKSDNPQQFSFMHTQSTAATTWVITHALGYYPIVRVFTNDTPPNEILPQGVTHNSTMQLTITFSSARAGTARLV